MVKDEDWATGEWAIVLDAWVTQRKRRSGLIAPDGRLVYRSLYVVACLDAARGEGAEKVLLLDGEDATICGTVDLTLKQE